MLKIPVKIIIAICLFMVINMAINTYELNLAMTQLNNTPYLMENWNSFKDIILCFSYLVESFLIVSSIYDVIKIIKENN